jgi:hypothetical protein
MSGEALGLEPYKGRGDFTLYFQGLVLEGGEMAESAMV